MSPWVGLDVYNLDSANPVKSSLFMASTSAKVLSSKIGVHIKVDNLLGSLGSSLGMAGGVVGICIGSILL